MKTAVNTLNKHLPYIKNSLKYPYNNGRIEGINNKIKVLSRVAYGYRNFNYFKNRIILHFKLRAVVKQKESSCSVALATEHDDSNNQYLDYNFTDKLHLTKSQTLTHQCVGVFIRHLE